jgi:membrane protein
MTKHRAILKSAYELGTDLSGGMVNTLRDAMQSFNRAQASQAAASLAYYAMFSLFPLLLALTGVAGFFLKGGGVSDRIITSVTRFVPVSKELMESNVAQVLERRGTIGLAGLAGLLWSGTGVLTVLTDHVNRAWTDAKPRGFLERRLIALGIGGTLAVLVLLSLLVAPILDILGRLETGVGDKNGVHVRPIWKWISGAGPALITFLVTLGLYRWVPNTDVKWCQAFSGASFVAATWEVAKRGFAWYVKSSLVNYPVVYGSLGGVVALMLWVYVSSLLALFGAHLSAAVASSLSASTADLTSAPST